jgi:hypothetical protein
MAKNLILTPTLCLQGCQNVAERKLHKGVCADCNFSQPEPPLVGGVAYTDCYVPFAFFN